MKTYVEKVIDNLYVIRIDDIETKYFEALWDIPEGITYNAYLLTTDEGAVLFDTWKHVYADLFIETLKKIIEPRDIKYIVVHHMEQDHSGALPKVLEVNNYKAVVYGHPLVANMIKAFYGISPSFKPVRDDEVLEVSGYKLRFIHTPWLHWPETIMTFIEELETLVSCDAFGSYSIPSGLFDEQLDDNELETYLGYSKKYVATVIGHYKEYVIKNIEKIKEQGINPKIIAPSHGLIWRSKPGLIMKKYMEWSKGLAREKKATIVYGSMYGEIGEAINYLIDKLVEKEWVVKTYAFTDKERASIGDILADIVDSKLLVIGVSTYEAGIYPLIRYVVELIVEKLKYDKPVLVIASYGWGPVAGNKVSEILRKAGFKLLDIIEFRGRMDKDVATRIDNLINSL